MIVDHVTWQQVAERGVECQKRKLENSRACMEEIYISVFYMNLVVRLQLHMVGCPRIELAHVT